MKEFEDFLQRMNLTDRNYVQEYLRAKQMKYSPLMDFMVRINGIMRPSFYDIAEEKNLKTIELVFTSPRVWGDWDFNDAVQEIRILPNGLGSVKVVSGKITPQTWMFEKHEFHKAMVRFIVEKSYTQGVHGLLTPAKLVELMKKGVMPYILRVVCYTKDMRYKVDLNLPNGNAIGDFRHGKIPPRLLKKRNPEEYFNFDHLYSKLDIPRFPKKVWEAIFESDGMDIEVLTLIFNVSERIIENNVAVLKKYGLVEVDEKNKIYRATVPKQAP